MHVKTSMRRLPQSSLSSEEARRCRTAAQGRAWDVWEEDTLLWSLDSHSWAPAQSADYPRRRRWLLVEDGGAIYPAMIWDVRAEARLPADPAAERQPNVLRRRFAEMLRR
jgi:hypothetical protein